MLIRTLHIFFILALIVIGNHVHGEEKVIGAYQKKAFDVSKKRFEQKRWSDNKKSDLMQKSFAFKHWDSHYSSLGSKKSDILSREAKKKKIFQSETVEFSKKEIDISNLNGGLADLERRAQISTDTVVREIEDKRIYNMMLQDSKKYSDTGEKLSLRDINRFQFRQNRSDDSVPVQQAGVSGDR